MAGFLQKLKPLQLDHNYRQAFTDEEAAEIEKQFDAGKRKARDGPFGPEVKAIINGLPVLIVHFDKTYDVPDKDKEIQFQSLLRYLEQAHQLVRWTGTYIVRFPHRVQVSGMRPKKKGRVLGSCCIM